ncbi:MAG: hypothetical protein ACRD2C_02095 [Acidimicrobiales bacterium]
MKITLVVHLEPDPAVPGALWWADSPDVDGFSAFASSLSELREQALEALRDVLGETSVELVERLEGANLDAERKDARVATTEIAA